MYKKYHCNKCNKEIKEIKRLGGGGYCSKCAEEMQAELDKSIRAWSQTLNDYPMYKE